MLKITSNIKKPKSPARKGAADAPEPQDVQGFVFFVDSTIVFLCRGFKTN